MHGYVFYVCHDCYRKADNLSRSKWSKTPSGKEKLRISKAKMAGGTKYADWVLKSTGLYYNEETEL